MSANTIQAALLAALQAIVNECKTFAHDHDSYLPPHLLATAQAAIDAIEAPAKATALTIEAARFTQLKAEFTKHGITLSASLMTAELFNVPVSYMADGARYRCLYLPTLADAEAFLVELKGVAR